ncbi:MAG: cell division protein [Proteobacteria bacterium]|nr:cell division protein [Pseudomonadota bacterium]
MWTRRSEVPFWREKSERFIPLIIALMVFLASLALATTMALDGAARQWQRGAAGTLTVQIPAPTEPLSAAMETARVDSVLSVLEAASGIERARVLPRHEIASLLERWLGEGNVSARLPLPTVIDVKIKPGGAFDLADVRRRLSTIVSGTSIDHHEQWLNQLVRLAQTVQFIGIAVVFLIGLASIAIVIFATRAGLAVHRDIIEVLHVIGAKDSYIAGLFQRHALWLGLRGGAYGLVLAMATFLLLAQLAIGLEGPFWTHLTFGQSAWIALASLPLVTALITTLTARITVLQALRSVV